MVALCEIIYLKNYSTYRRFSRVILKYAQFRPSHGSIRLDPVFDEKQDRYLLMQVGWDRESMAILFI